MEPTVIAAVPRNADMVVQESFGPPAPILTFKDIDDVIALSNLTHCDKGMRFACNSGSVMLTFGK